MSRQHIDAPHSFLYKFRMDLDPRELAQLPGRPRELDAYDVFCIPKQFMASTSAKPPVLVLPNSRFGKLQTRAPSSEVPVALSGERRRKLRELAACLIEFTKSWSDAHSYIRAAQDLQQLADGWTGDRSQDGFLESAAEPRDDPIPASTNPYFGNIPDACWDMRVAFGRR